MSSFHAFKEAETAKLEQMLPEEQGAVRAKMEAYSKEAHFDAVLVLSRAMDSQTVQ